MMKPIASTIAALALAALCSAGTYLALERSAAEPAVRPVWTEIKWPFPLDEWGIGKAFGCRALDCGSDVELYLRAKIGFCNCTTGVADDKELERVADLDLLVGALRERAACLAALMNADVIQPLCFANARPAVLFRARSHCSREVSFPATDGAGPHQPNLLEVGGGLHVEQRQCDILDGCCTGEQIEALENKT
jgi:hypothetical protein